jgi:hypothetical protein
VAIQEQFQRFLSDIEPSATTQSNASSAHTSLRAHLEQHETFSQYHLSTFLSGSYKRDTAIRPIMVADVVTRPDVDIIAVTSHTLSDRQSVVLGLLYSALKDKYGASCLTLNRRSVHVETCLADMDVVPIIAPSGMEGTLYIPDRDLKQWLETNPPGHTTWTTEMNDKSVGRFKPLVKLTKWWRRENPTRSKKPKGFVLECITAECMNLQETQYAELFVGTLETIVSRYQAYVSAGIVPWIQDPGVLTNSVTSKVSFEEFRDFYAKVKAYAELGRRAINETDDEKALVPWRRIFGNRFPAAIVFENRSYLAPAVVPSSLTFPDKPIIPRKPGGFA